MRRMRCDGLEPGHRCIGEACSGTGIGTEHAHGPVFYDQSRLVQQTTENGEERSEWVNECTKHKALARSRRASLVFGVCEHRNRMQNARRTSCERKCARYVSHRRNRASRTASKPSLASRVPPVQSIVGSAVHGTADIHSALRRGCAAHARPPQKHPMACSSCSISLPLPPGEAKWMISVGLQDRKEKKREKEKERKITQKISRYLGRKGTYADLPKAALCPRRLFPSRICVPVSYLPEPPAQPPPITHPHMLGAAGRGAGSRPAGGGGSDLRMSPGAALGQDNAEASRRCGARAVGGAQRAIHPRRGDVEDVRRTNKRRSRTSPANSTSLSPQPYSTRCAGLIFQLEWVTPIHLSPLELTADD
ncbi:hypothetical protein B0H13DRAFT_1881021 [Mycena leptocephala]|nr:hypothetical protein B0H13DRAFT_1881021 [Mycena leptocephala]